MVSEKIESMLNIQANHVESIIILLGLFAVLIAAFVPIRFDIQLLWVGFGSHLVIAGVLAKVIPVQS